MNFDPLAQRDTTTERPSRNSGHYSLGGGASALASLWLRTAEAAKFWPLRSGEDASVGRTDGLVGEHWGRAI